MTHYHFIGIGGTGLSAIARVLLEGGHQVSGSDLNASPLLQAVADAGGQVSVGHKAEQVAGADLVIRSSAIPDGNVEVRQAQALGIPVLKRSEFLGDLLGNKKCLAVAGSHGKTTTTAMLAWVIDQLGMDPGYIIGGTVRNLGTNAHAGNGEYFIIEADEYDHMFLGLTPTIAVVTNVEHDHPDMFPTEESFFDAFRQFADRIEPGGTLLYCIDDPGAKSLVNGLNRTDIDLHSYGLSAGADYQAADLIIGEAGMDYSAKTPSGDRYRIRLRLAGDHNVRNSLAVFAIVDMLQMPVAQAITAISRFEGSGRRFEIVGQVGGITVVDDYAHHPTEIRATLAAARQRFRNQPLVVVWQPHTYSRTLTLQADYMGAFQDADQLIITDVFAAREAKPDGFDMREIVAGIHQDNVFFIPAFDDIIRLLQEQLKIRDVLLVLSAGDAVQISRAVVDALKKQVGTGVEG